MFSVHEGNPKSTAGHTRAMSAGRPKSRWVGMLATKDWRGETHIKLGHPTPGEWPASSGYCENSATQGLPDGLPKT